MIVGLRAFEGRLTVKVSSNGRSEWQEMEGARWINVKLFAAYQQCSGAAGGAQVRKLVKCWRRVLQRLSVVTVAKIVV